MGSLGFWFAPFYPLYRKTTFATLLKRRRYRRIIQTLGIAPPATILEVGCHAGADFLQFAAPEGFRCHGLDLEPQPPMCQFPFTQGDACNLPFADKSFDAVVSIGVFEHIQPIEALCQAASEIARVGRRYLVLVPAISSPVEPHTLSPFWGIRDFNRKWHGTYPLHLMSDDSWLQFRGFQNARTQRIWYAPGIQNLMIYDNR